MKKKQKFAKITPVIETKEEPIIPGSVGEFIEVLKEFPADGEFTLNGNVNIKGIDNENPDRQVTIYPRESVKKCVCSDCVDKCEEVPCDCNEDEHHNTTLTDDVMGVHLYGIADDNYNYLKAIRHTSADNLTNGLLLDPNEHELDFERDLMPNQRSILAEIRDHNANVAEFFGELYRRQIAALLEYNTQCIAHFAYETNKDMCVIVEHDEE